MVIFLSLLLVGVMSALSATVSYFVLVNTDIPFYWTLFGVNVAVIAVTVFVYSFGDHVSLRLDDFGF